MIGAVARAPFALINLSSSSSPWDLTRGSEHSGCRGAMTFRLAMQRVDRDGVQHHDHFQCTTGIPPARQVRTIDHSCALCRVTFKRLCHTWSTTMMLSQGASCVNIRVRRMPTTWIRICWHLLPDQRCIFTYAKRRVHVYPALFTATSLSLARHRGADRRAD